jgi:hypothetical protein
MSMVLRGKTVLKEPDPEEPAHELLSSDGNRKLANSASKWIGRLRRRFQRTKLPKTPGRKSRRGTLWFVWFGWRCTIPSSAQIGLSSSSRRNLARTACLQSAV